MQVIIAFMMLAAVVVFGISAVVAFANSGAGRYKKQLKGANERLGIAQAALSEIAAGDAMPVIRASEALSEINKSYTKELS